MPDADCDIALAVLQDGNDEDGNDEEGYDEEGTRPWFSPTPNSIICVPSASGGWRR
jgi:hypothetical protein